MKRLIFSAVALTVTFCVFAQHKTIKSIELDRAIYSELSQYRVKNGKTPLGLFIEGTLRDFSYDITHENCGEGILKLTPKDEFKLYANSECIVRSKVSTSNAGEYDIEQNSDFIPVLAKTLVNALLADLQVNSAEDVLKEDNEQGTVTSVIKIFDSKVLISVTYHAIATPYYISDLPDMVEHELSYLRN